LILDTMQREAIEAYSKVTGSNYSGDDPLYEALTKTVIPKYGFFVSRLTDIHPLQEEIKLMHKIYVEGAMLQLESFKIVKEAIEKQDVNLVTKANIKLSQGREKIEEWRNRMNALK